MIPAVIYGVKSTRAEEGVVENQAQIAQDAALDEGKHTGHERVIVGRFEEEGQSGYRKSRGPELARAIEAAVAAADEHDEAELWVWHSSRLARGNGRKGGARSLLKLYGDLMEQGVTPRSATDDAYLREEFIGMASRQNAKYSEDLSIWTEAGIKRRMDRGESFGTIPTGYTREQIKLADGTTQMDKRGRVVHQRVVDPVGAQVVERIFAGFEAGETPGEIARALNASGARTHHGNPWARETVRELSQRALYTGQEG